MCYVVVPNLLTFAAFGLSVAFLALKLKASGSLLWYIVVAVAVATGTATAAILAFYIYTYCRDIAKWVHKKTQPREESERLLLRRTTSYT